MIKPTGVEHADLAGPHSARTLQIASDDAYARELCEERMPADLIATYIYDRLLGKPDHRQADHEFGWKRVDDERPN